MAKLPNIIKNFLADLLFPAFCVSCQREGTYLCADCLALVDLPENLYCPFCRPPKITLRGETCKSCKNKGAKLNGLFFSTSYQNSIVKKIIQQLKYSPYIKELAKVSAFLIIRRFQIVEKKSFPQPDLKNSVIVPVPLTKKKLKQRGFNQSEELSKELTKFFNVPLINNRLLKSKETLPQAELSKTEREENIKNAFSCQSSETIRGKAVFLVDDVFTTGFTMEECARVLKNAGVKSVWGITVARE